MNYATHYERLIARAKSRVLSGYVERHHVVPVCIGGTDDLGNLVALTPEEHYVAHQLLVKMHPGNGSLVWAAMCMTGKNQRHARKNKIYGWLRRRFAEMVSKQNSGRKHTAEQKRKMSERRLGVSFGPHSEATKEKMSRASKGKPKSVEHRAALSAAKIGKRQGQQSAEHVAKRVAATKKSLVAKGRQIHFDNPIYKHLQSEKMKLVWARRRGASSRESIQSVRLNRG